MNVLEDKLNFLNRVAEYWNNYNISFDFSNAVNKSDNLTIYHRTKRELDLMLEGYNIDNNSPLKLIQDKVIYESDDKRYKINVYTYKLVRTEKEKTIQCLYRPTKDKHCTAPDTHHQLSAQNIDFKKLDFDTMTFVDNTTIIPYRNINPDITFSLIIDGECNTSFSIEHNEHSDEPNKCVILNLSLTPDEELQLFKMIHLYRMCV